MVLFAAFLDGIDGRLARMMKATSKFGAQMDSLADIVNFGVAPALVLYAFLLDRAGSPGWIAALLLRHRLQAEGWRVSTCSTKTSTVRHGRPNISSACRHRPAPCWCSCRSISPSSASISRTA